MHATQIRDFPEKACKGLARKPQDIPPRRPERPLLQAKCAIHIEGSSRETLVRQLHRCEFMDGAENVALIGGPGTGKSRFATALGIQAIDHHRTGLRFFSAEELVNALEQEKARGKAG